MSLLFHNNTVSLYDNWYESHASLLRAVCLELGHSDKINELMEKFVGEKMKMKAKKNKNTPKKAKSAYFFYCDEKRPALLEKEKKKGGKVNIGEVAKELGKMWQKLSADKKKKYEKMNLKDKERYEKEMAEFTQKNA
jgi:hypothetical protein|tara:strand:- start:72 stop:482 length:411 start_codon:yes stop_codon:yes gene_type:complete